MSGLVLRLASSFVLREQISQVVLRQGGQYMVNHMEALLSYMLQLHLLRPVQVLDLG